MNWLVCLLLARNGPPRMLALRLLTALNRTSRGQPNSVENNPKRGMHQSHSITSQERTRIDVGMMMANPNRCEDALLG